MDNKTIKFGDREYEIKNKAEEVMLNKWDRAITTLEEVYEEYLEHLHPKEKTSEKTDCYFYVQAENGNFGNNYPQFCYHPDYKHLPLGENLPCENCSYYINKSDTFDLIVCMSRRNKDVKKHNNLDE